MEPELINRFAMFAIVGFLVATLAYHFIRGSRWEELKKKYRITGPPSVKLDYLQSAILNEAACNLIGLGINSTGIYIKVFTCIFIPFSDLEPTGKKKHLLYDEFRIKGTDLTIGLNSYWSEKVTSNHPH